MKASRIYLPQLAPKNLLLQSLAGSLIIALSAQAILPLLPVPVSLQTLAVLAIGLLWGSKIATGSMLLYLLEGACGLPVFSKLGAGVPHLLGPTGGYLLGMLITAWLAGRFADMRFNRGFLQVMIAGVISLIPTFVIGSTYLAQFIGWNKVMAVGVAPFILGELLKITFLAFVIPSLKKN